MQPRASSIKQKIALDELFNSPFVRILEERRDPEFKSPEASRSESQTPNSFLVTESRKLERLCDPACFHKEGFLLRVLEPQFERAGLRHLCSSCAEPPLGFFAKLMPTVLPPLISSIFFRPKLCEFMKKVEDVRIFRALGAGKAPLDLNDQKAFGSLLEKFLKEANKLDRVGFKAEKFLEELSRDMVLMLLEEVKAKTYQKVLPGELVKIFSPAELLRPLAKMSVPRLIVPKPFYP